MTLRRTQIRRPMRSGYVSTVVCKACLYTIICHRHAGYCPRCRSELVRAYPIHPDGSILVHDGERRKLPKFEHEWNEAIGDRRGHQTMELDFDE